MIRDGLGVDHLYISVSKDELRELRGLCDVLVNCPYLEVKSGRDEWRGIYPRANVGSYFEMVEEYQPELGIAFSPFYVQYLDARKIVSETPKLKWHRGRRFSGTNKKIWFEWLSLRPYDRPQGNQDAINAWIMHYHFNHLEKVAVRRKQASVDRFKRLVVSMGRENLANLKEQTQWIPGERVFARRGAELLVPDRDGGTLAVEIQFKAGKAPAQFVQIEAQACPDVKTRSARLRGFRLSATRGNLILSRR